MIILDELYPKGHFLKYLKTVLRLCQMIFNYEGSGMCEKGS